MSPLPLETTRAMATKEPSAKAAKPNRNPRYLLHHDRTFFDHIKSPLTPLSRPGTAARIAPVAGVLQEATDRGGIGIPAGNLKLDH